MRARERFTVTKWQCQAVVRRQKSVNVTNWAAPRNETKKTTTPISQNRRKEKKAACANVVHSKQRIFMKQALMSMHCSTCSVRRVSYIQRGVPTSNKKNIRWGAPCTTLEIIILTYTYYLYTIHSPCVLNKKQPLAADLKVSAGPCYTLTFDISV